MFPQPWGGGDGDVLFVAEHPHFLSALWPSTICHIRKAGWWGLRAALVCGYRDTNLEGSLSLYPLSRIRAVVYSQVLWTPNHEYLVRHAFPLVKWVLSPTRTWLVTLYHRVTVTLMGMSYHSSHYCSSWGSQLDKTVGDFPSNNWTFLKGRTPYLVMGFLLVTHDFQGSIIFLVYLPILSPLKPLSPHHSPTFLHMTLKLFDFSYCVSYPKKAFLLLFAQKMLYCT